MPEKLKIGGENMPERKTPDKETYNTDEIEKYLAELEKDPKKLEKFGEMAEARAKDIYESGGFENEFQAGDLVLYAGAGTGHVPKYIEERHEDIKMVKIDLADIRTSDTKEGETRYAKANVRNLPFEDNSLDTVCLFDILHHTENQEEILKEARRVLKPGGKILILEDTIPEPYKRGADTMKKLVGKMDDMFNKQAKGVNPHNYHSISDWEIMFHKQGFDVDANDTKSWYWGPRDFLPEKMKGERPESRTLGRPFESSLFKIIKGEEPEKEPDFTEEEEKWFKN
ncbi:class I SAM-dependent methyltransferase [Patescibacteria group bacterium]|nr:class I SAM-dependent methyltransferase [Patescibacteria group bacterium]